MTANQTSIKTKHLGKAACTLLLSLSGLVTQAQKTAASVQKDQFYTNATATCEGSSWQGNGADGALANAHLTRGRLDNPGPDTLREAAITDRLEVDSVWAANKVSFDLQTVGNRQYVAYYNKKPMMTVAVRELGSTVWTKKELPSTNSIGTRTTPSCWPLTHEATSTSAATCTPIH